jgi:opacity protein-like surface antigen
MRRIALAVFLILCGATIAAAAPADQAPATPANQPPRPTPDFLFGEPRGAVGVRGSWVFARAGSDVFDFVRQQLTVDQRAFDAPAVGADLALTVTSRIDAVIGFEFSQASAASEYRNFVDNNRQPIEQTTQLKEANVGGTLRVALRPRGVGISRFAWIPRTVTPYVGAGGGFLWYEFTQSGDFVDVLSPNLAVFSDVITSQGWTPSAHALGGVDVKVFRRVFATVEGRYLWAAATLQRRFEDFDPIDLAGFRVSAGLNVLF